MAFEDCVNSARDQGALQQDEAEELKDRFRSYRDRMKGEADPDAAAKAKLEADLREAAARRERLAQLSADKIADIREHLESYRGTDGKPDVLAAAMGILENRNNLLVGVPSVVGRRDALIGYAHAQLEQGLYQFRRTFGLGKRMNQARLSNIVDEAFGKGTSDRAARGFLETWRKVADDFVDRFNVAGGDVGKLRDYFPQSHDARKLASQGPQAWIDFIKPRLDLDRMTDPLTGGPLVGSRLDEALTSIYRRIVTDGAIDREPTTQPQGRGALANQRQDARFLQFKDAGAWRDYAQAFGNPDVFAVMMDHLHGFAKDIAALDILGPNPGATVEWMKQVIQSEAAKAKLGEPTLYQGSLRTQASGRLSPNTQALERLWNVVNGSVGSGNLAAADIMATLRNVNMAAQLARSAVTAFVTDPAQAIWASRFQGVPALRWLAQMPRQLLSHAGEHEVAQAGLVIEDAMEHLRTDVQRLGWAAASKELSRFLPDRVFTWTGLVPYDMAKRRAGAFSFMFDAASRAGQSLDQIASDGLLGDRFARHLQGFGIDEPTWDLIREAQGSDHGEAGRLLRPVDVIAGRADDPQAFEAFLRYSEAMHAFAEEVGPRGTARTRVTLGRDLPAGTLRGELMREVSSYITYPATMLMSLFRATALEMSAGKGRGVAFGATAFTTLTLFGAALLEVKSLYRGQDPEKIDSPDFWLRAISAGGALGYFGDMLFADYQRGASDTKAHLAGPLVGQALDLLGATGGFRSLTQDHEINRAARLVGWSRQISPLTGMWWLKPVTDRLIWDRLQQLADPKAQASWARKAGQLMKEKGQGVWWRPGQAVPDRAPDFRGLW